MAILNDGERKYVKGLKRKERGDMTRILVNPTSKVVPIRVRVMLSKLPDPIKSQMFHQLSISITDKYLQWCLKMLQVPIGVFHTPSSACGDIQKSLHRAKEAMDEVIVGQDVAKREVLKIVHQSLMNPRETPTAYSLGLEGKPGCGKTQFVQRAMRAALKRPVVSIPLGGASDGSAYLWGHNYSYEGSKEGRLVAGLIEAGCCNPIVHFDEVDKVFDRDKGGNEIISSLIHLVDPSANSHLRDRYLHGLDIDFSKCIFVFSYNDANKINPVLLNRMRRVEFETPSVNQKKRIVTEQLIPRAQKRLRTSISMEDSAIDFLVQFNEGDHGLRDVEKGIDHVLSCASLNQVLKGEVGDVVTLRSAQEMMQCFSRVVHDAPPAQMYT